MSTDDAIRLLQEDRYAELARLWATSTTSSSKVPDIEEVLSAAADEFEAMNEAGVRPEPGRTWDRRQDLQSALGEFYYFAFELLRNCSSRHRGLGDNYRALSESWAKTPFSVVTLNYDVLLEQSIEAAGNSWVHAPYQASYAIPVAKIHGSINWLYPGARGISFGNGEYSVDLFKAIARSGYSNRFWTGPLRAVPIAELFQLGVESVVRSGSDYDRPALLPPFGSHKDYDLVREFRLIWSRARYFLGIADRLVIVGSRLRKLDQRLRDTLRESVREGTEIVLAGGGASALEGLRESLPWVNAERVVRFSNFAAYVAQL